MSSSDRRSLLVFLALAGCGFTPVYGPAGGGTALRGRIATQNPTDKSGYDLVARLEERLGRVENARYRIDFKITTKRIGGGVTPDNSVTRYTLRGHVDWSLVDVASGAAPLAGVADSVTGYSATGSTVAGLTAEGDAGTRLMIILADQIVTRILAAAPTLTP